MRVKLRYALPIISFGIIFSAWLTEFDREKPSAPAPPGRPAGAPMPMPPLDYPEPSLESFIAPPLPPPAGASAALGLVAVDRAIALLLDGHVAFNVPGRMHVGQTHAIQAALMPGAEVARLVALLSAPGARETASIKITERMRATLTGGGAFDVTPSGPQQQFVGLQEPTTWHWEVTAKLKGKHDLTLAFEALLNIGGSDGPKRVRTLARTIEVEVEWPDTVAEWVAYLKEVAEGLSYLWLSVLVPIGIWIGNRWRRARAPEADSPVGPNPSA
jgi:hypothetical protein